MIKSSQYSLQEVDKLPNDPGVYFFHNKSSKIIYVGKAKDLKKRVSSYFNDIKQISIKTRKLVSEICTIEVMVVNSEYEALLLENNLIKNHQPRYNILLKDDKSYPYICVTNERFPKLVLQRRADSQLGKLYGPFTSTKIMNQIVELVKEICPLRTCNYNLSEKNIIDKKFKVCLEYHLGNCLGPCVGYQNEEDYNISIARAINLLKGNFGEVRRDLKDKMLTASEAMAYEKALFYKNKLDIVESYQAKSIIINPNSGNLDVFGIITHEENIFINYLQVINGAIGFAKTVEFQKKLDDDVQNVLPTIIFELITRYNSSANERLSNIEVNTDAESLKIIVPQIGDKKKLILLAVKNALIAKQEFINRSEETVEKVNETLKTLQADLCLTEVPMHIECFDNSNLSGTNPVASMVCFKNAKPAKKCYRHYNIKTVVGANDFASMYEIVYRRYKNAEEESNIPNLIVVDGGKGQLSSAVDALRDLGLYGKVAIVSIAKRLEEIYFPNDSHPLHISKKSASLKLLQRLRNEAHRFAIEFHRKKRSDNSLKSILDDIKGLGPKSIEKLLQKFEHVDNIRSATEDQIAEVLGIKKALLLKKELIYNESF